MTKAEAQAVGAKGARIIQDPDPVGGFARDAMITGLEHMLESGTFTVGTILRYGGRVWRVRPGDGRQELERCS